MEGGGVRRLCGLGSDLHSNVLTLCLHRPKKAKGNVKRLLQAKQTLLFLFKKSEQTPFLPFRIPLCMV